MRHDGCSIQQPVFVFRQTVFQEHQTFGGVGYVLAMSDSRAPVWKKSLNASRACCGHGRMIHTEEALQGTVIQRHVGQTAHVHYIVDVRMSQVQTHEAIDGCLSQRQIGIFIVCVDEI